MSTHPTHSSPTTRPAARPTRLRRAAGTAVLTAALLGAGGSVALAVPAPAEPSCAEVLVRAAQWPGTLGSGLRAHSDAYERHLLRQPACAQPEI